MAPLPTNSTSRFFVKYNNGVDDHEVMFRYPEESNLSALKLVVADWFEALDPILYAITIIGARHSFKDSTVSSPVVTGLAAGYGTGAMPEVSAPRELRFEGRSFDGRRVSWSIYAQNIGTPDTYRFNADDNANIDAAIAVLGAAAAVPSICSVSGETPIIYPYANVNFNSYWERQRRG